VVDISGRILLNSLKPGSSSSVAVDRRDPWVLDLAASNDYSWAGLVRTKGDLRWALGAASGRGGVAHVCVSNGFSWGDPVATATQ